MNYALRLSGIEVVVYGSHPREDETSSSHPSPLLSTLPQLSGNHLQGLTPRQRERLCVESHDVNVLTHVGWARWILSCRSPFCGCQSPPLTAMSCHEERLEAGP